VCALLGIFHEEVPHNRNDQGNHRNQTNNGNKGNMGIPHSVICAVRNAREVPFIFL
jgi:hypothetical protein